MTFWVAGAAIGGALITSAAAGDAADSQAASSADATAEQRRQYDLTREDTAPYRTAGAGALGELSNLTGVGDNFDAAAYLKANPDVAADPYYSQHALEHYQKFGRAEGRAAPQNASYGSYAKPLTQAEVQLDPGYEFARQQGQQAIDRRTAAAGGRISGAALKAASQYNTDYATTGYSTAYNRVNQARSDRLNRLAALGNIGQTGTQQVGVAGQNAANAISGIVTAQGNASGAAQIAQGNIWGGAGNQLAALYGRNTTPTTSTSGWGSTGSGFGTGAQYGNQDYGAYL